MSTDALALLGALLAVVGCLVFVLGLVAGAPIPLVVLAWVVSIVGAVLVRRVTDQNR